MQSAGQAEPVDNKYLEIMHEVQIVELVHVKQLFIALSQVSHYQGFEVLG